MHILFFRLHSQVMNSPVCLSETEHAPVLIQGVNEGSAATVWKRRLLLEHSCPQRTT